MVRESHPEDIPQITAICNHYIESSTAVFDEQPMSEAQMLRRYEEVAMHGLPFLVDWHDGEVTGYCYAHPWKEKSAYGGTLEITIYLSPAFLGRGIGSRLLGQTIEACRRHGAHALIACITGGNVASREQCRNAPRHSVEILRNLTKTQAAEQPNLTFFGVPTSFF